MSQLTWFASAIAAFPRAWPGRQGWLGDAFAHYERIFKTLHLLQLVSDEGYRRMIGAQLNVTEARHRLARLSRFSTTT
ncbi:Tn3 family transposase [Streptomyces sp. NPDC001492]